MIFILPVSYGILKNVIKQNENRRSYTLCKQLHVPFVHTPLMMRMTKSSIVLYAVLI